MCVYLHAVRHACRMSVHICVCVVVHAFTCIDVFNTEIYVEVWTMCILTVSLLCVYLCVYNFKALWWSFSWTAWSRARRSPSGGLCSWTASSPVCWRLSASPMENAHAMTPRFIYGSVTLVVFPPKCQADWMYIFKSLHVAKLYSGIFLSGGLT